jgi:hypothetical protein
MKEAGCGHRVDCGLYGIITGMKKHDVKQVLRRVLTWPEPAQEEALALLRAIENERVGGGDYHATAEELTAIDEADRSGVASEEEVEAAFRAFRMA